MIDAWRCMQDDQYIESERTIPNDEPLSGTTRGNQHGGQECGHLLLQAELRNHVLQDRLEELEKKAAALRLEQMTLSVSLLAVTCFSASFLALAVDT